MLDRDPRERADAALAHANHYASVAAELDDLEGRDYDGFIALGDRELGNLHAALGWAYANGRPSLGLTISRQMWGYHVGKRMHDIAMTNLRTGITLTADMTGSTADILEAAALALIAAHNTDDHDREFAEFVASTIEVRLEGLDDPAIRATALRGLASHRGHTDPALSDVYLREAQALESAPPRSRFLALHNRILTSWWLGKLDDGDVALRQVEDLIAMDLPTLAPYAAHLEATIAARAGRWDDVIRIAEAPDHRSNYARFNLQVVHVEALTALGRVDEAALVLAELDLIASADHVYWVPYLRAALELARDRPGAAVASLEDRVEEMRAIRAVSPSGSISPHCSPSPHTIWGTTRPRPSSSDIPHRTTASRHHPQGVGPSSSRACNRGMLRCARRPGVG